MGGQDVVGEACGLFAEEEGVARAEVGVPDGLGGASGEEPESSRALRGELERGGGAFPRIVLGGRESGPVIEAGSTEGVDGGVEAEGTDEVEGAAHGDAGATDIAGVVGDLGLVQDDVEECGHGEWGRVGAGIGRRGTEKWKKFRRGIGIPDIQAHELSVMSVPPDNKEAIRDEMRRRLRSLGTEDAKGWSGQVCSRIAGTSFFARAETLMVYLPIPGEVDITGLALRAFQEGKTVCVPRVDWRAGHMMAVEIRSLDDEFVEEKRGVKEPAGGRSVCSEEIDLVLVPGLAFDAVGRRLGRGGGFYDRFLADPLLRRGGLTTTCGVAFDFQVIEQVPTLGHDMRVDAVVTERRLIRAGCSNRSTM